MHYLLALRADNPARSCQDYVNELAEAFGIQVSRSSISRFFLERFNFAGSFRKPILVPLDKFKITNVTKYYEFMFKVNELYDHTRWVFFDEKHLVNMDTLNGKVRANPLTGAVDAIGVSGDFRTAYTLIAAITVNPFKQRSMCYSISENNGDSAAFMSFIRSLIMSGWLSRGDVACMDNARIHTGGESTWLADLLWNFQMPDGQPLNVLLVLLPPRCPELNPIELVFHIVARRIRSLRVRSGLGPCDREVVRYSSVVMDHISFETIAKCYVHCGY